MLMHMPCTPSAPARRPPVLTAPPHRAPPLAAPAVLLLLLPLLMPLLPLLPPPLLSPLLPSRLLPSLLPESLLLRLCLAHKAALRKTSVALSLRGTAAAAARQNKLLKTVDAPCSLILVAVQKHADKKKTRDRSSLAHS